MRDLLHVSSAPFTASYPCDLLFSLCPCSLHYILSLPLFPSLHPLSPVLFTASYPCTLFSSSYPSPCPQFPSPYPILVPSALLQCVLFLCPVPFTGPILAFLSFIVSFTLPGLWCLPFSLVCSCPRCHSLHRTLAFSSSYPSLLHSARPVISLFLLSVF